MGFHELGHDLVLAVQLGFELLDLLAVGIVAGLGFAAVGLEGQVAVLEELLEPAVELVGEEPSSSHRSETGTLSMRCRLRAATFTSAVWYDRVVSDMAGYLRSGYITRPRVLSISD